MGQRLLGGQITAKEGGIRHGAAGACVSLFPLEKIYSFDL